MASFRGRFHTGVARTHVAQDHTKHTASRRHSHVDDGGLHSQTVRPEFNPHVRAKRDQHDDEDWDRPYVSTRHASEHRSWESLGEAPASHRQMEHHSDRGAA